MGEGCARPAVKPCIPHSPEAMSAALDELAARARDARDSHASDVEAWTWAAQTYLAWVTVLKDFKTTKAQRHVFWLHPYCSPLQFEASRAVIKEICHE